MGYDDNGQRDGAARARRYLSVYVVAVGNVERAARSILAQDDNADRWTSPDPYWCGYREGLVETLLVADGK